MESVKRHETGWLQHGLLVIAVLVAVIMLGTTAGLLARHFSGSGSSSPAPATHSSGPARPLNSDSQSGYAGNRVAPSGAQAFRHE
ncbi:MAG TPA: hypothetical protein VI316_09175 [Candidatus Dormibacteraeota bacterium]